MNLSVLDVFSSYKQYENLFKDSQELAEYFSLETIRMVNPYFGINSILEYGVGAGRLALRLLRDLRGIKYTGIDFSIDMISEAKRKLDCLPQLSGINLINISFEDYEPKSNHFDLAISVNSLHHLEHAKKKTVFRKIFSALKTPAIFIYSDVISSPSIPIENMIYQYRTEERMLQLTSEQFHQRVKHFGTENRLNWNDTKKQLNEAGFEEIDIVYKHLYQTLFLCIKGQVLQLRSPNFPYKI